MHFGVAPLRPMPFHPAFHPAPQPFRPAPRMITREVVVRPPPRVIYQPGPTRTVYTPGPTVYRTDYAAIAQARSAQAAWDREHFQLERMAMHDREAAARLALLQQQLQIAQAAAAAAAARAAVQTPPPPPVPSYDASVPGTPQNVQTVSPSAPAADLTPAQDASAPADAGADAGGGEPAHKPHHLVLFVGLIAVAGVGGYVLMKKKKAKKSSGE